MFLTGRMVMQLSTINTIEREGIWTAGKMMSSASAHGMKGIKRHSLGIHLERL